MVGIVNKFVLLVLGCYLPQSATLVDAFQNQRGKSRDFYKILGVNRKATTREIDRAYRAKAKTSHPDKNPGKETEWQNISDAHEVLSDAESRKKYDVAGESGLGEGQDMGGSHGFPFGGRGGTFTFSTNGGGMNFGGFNVGDIGSMFDGGFFEGGFPGGQGGGARRQQQGRQKPQQKRAFPFAKDEAIKEINTQNWDQIISTAEKLGDDDIRVSMVYFRDERRYAKDALDKLDEKFRDISKKMKAYSIFGAVDCQVSTALCRKWVGEAKTTSNIPLLFFDQTKKTLHYAKYNSNSMSVSSWTAFLSDNYPGSVTSVTINNFETWYAGNNDMPSLVLLTTKTQTPVMLKWASHEYSKQIGFSIITNAESSGLLSIFDQLSNTSLPAIFHIDECITTPTTHSAAQNYIKCYGEIIKAGTISSDSLSLTLGRILAQKKSKTANYLPYVSEYTRHDAKKGTCGQKDAQFCFFIAYYSKHKIPHRKMMAEIKQGTDDIHDIFLKAQDLGERFASDPAKIFLLNLANAPDFANKFNLTSKCNNKQECFSGVISYRPKRKKFQTNPMDTFSYSDIENIIENVVSGGTMLSNKIPTAPQLPAGMIIKNRRDEL